MRILVRGGGDLGSGVIYRLYRAGFSVVVAELPTPLFVRRTVCYGAAVFEQTLTIGGLTARLCPSVGGVDSVLAAGEIPVLVAPDRAVISQLQPDVVVDCRMAKSPLDTQITDAPLVVAIGPGFVVGEHCHAVVETNRGHFLGHVLRQGFAEPDTGIPGSMNGRAASRVLRASVDGHVDAHARIGDAVIAGDLLAEVNGVPVYVPFDGVLRGMIHPSVNVTAGMKIGDIDPRVSREHCFTISDKSLAVGGGVVEAVLSSDVVRERLVKGLA